MAEQVKIGVIGTSWYADLVVLPVFANSPRARLSAICERSRERANRANGVLGDVGSQMKCSMNIPC